MRLSSTVLGGAFRCSVPLPHGRAAWAQTEQEQQAQAQTIAIHAAAPELGRKSVTATKREPRAGRALLDQRADAEGYSACQRQYDRGNQPQRRGPGRSEPRPGASQVTVRGASAGQIVRDQAGVKEQVGVYLDESVISSLFTPDFDLFDLKLRRLLRGPCRTLFGSGSVGGTVRYITNQPKLGVTEALVEANVNTVDEGDLGWHLKGAGQHADRRDPRPPGSDLRDGLRGIYRCTSGQPAARM